MLRIHEVEVGGRLRDPGVLDSAVMRPQQTVAGADAFVGTHAKAAALLESLIRNHPFVDGNKRTAVLATRMFYNLNGMELRPNDDQVIDLAYGVAERLMDHAAIAERLEAWAYPFELGQPE